MAKILIVDDESSIRVLLREILEYSGHEVLEADSGNKAIGIYLEHEASIDLVITDLIMPGKTGIDLIMEIKEQNNQVKILAITGGGGIPGTTNYLALADLLGAIKTIKKPFSANSICSEVEAILA